MTITNPYYEFDPTFTPGTKARSDAVNLQYQAIQNAFDFLPSSNDALTTGTSTFAPESGAADAYVVTMPDTRLSEQDGDEIVFFATNANTGASTLEVDGLGPKAIVDWEGLALDSGNIIAGICYIVRYDATNTRYQLTSPKGNYGASAAADAAAAAASASDAADSATEAMQWAVNPEDDDVDSAPGEFSSFHWAQKALAAASTNRINTDIATATPPTTEAVTGNYEIYDATDDDQLARIGYNAVNTLAVVNMMHGGQVILAAQDAAGTQQTLVAGDPDGAVTLQYDGAITARTIAAASGGFEVNNTLTGGGIERVLTESDADAAITSIINADINTATPPTTEAVTAELIYRDLADDDDLALLGFQASNDFEIHNYMTDGDIIFYADISNGSHVEVARASGGAVLDDAWFQGNRLAGVSQNSFSGSGNEPTLTLGGRKDDGGGELLCFWPNTIQKYGNDFTSVGNININPDGGAVTIGTLGGAIGTGGVDLYHNGLRKIATSSAAFVYFPNTSATAPSGGTVGADNSIEISTSSLSPIARMGVRASDDVAYLGHDIHGRPWVIEAQNEVGSDRAIMLLDATSTAFGAYVGRAGTTNQGSMWIYEMAAALADQAAYGQFWVRDDAPNTPMFTDDTGVDYVLNDAGGNVSNTGTPLNNQIAVWTDATTLEGDAGLTYSGTIFSLGAGDTLDFSAVMEIREGRIDLNGLATGLQITGQDENDDGLVLEDGARVTWEDLAFANHVYLRNEGIGGGSGTLTMRADSTASFILAGTGLQWNNSGLTTPISANILTTPTRLNISDAVNIQGELYLTDRQNAGTDIAAQGQVWVQNDAPNHLMYTDDTGDDFTVGIAGGHSGANVVVNGSHNFNTTDNRAGNFIYIGFDGGADTITLGNSTGTGLTNWPLYTSIQLIVPGSNTVTVTEGTGTTLYDETGTDTVGGVTVSQGVVTIFRQDATTYIIWGSGWT